MIENAKVENLIVRYLNGACTPEELIELQEYVNQNNHNRKEFFGIKDIWDGSLIVKKETDQLLQFYKTQYERSKKSHRIFLRRAASIAAVLLTGLILAVSFYPTAHLKSGNQQVFTVPLGSRSKVLLPDGTEINLNSGSELAYDGNFSAENRMVTLTGEAYFHVKSDASHPFVVKTKDFDVLVTGTQFNVCSYPEDQFASSTLAEGKINLKINNSSKTLEIKPGEKFALNHITNSYTLHKADIDQEIAWKNGEFIFRNISFPELMTRLERWYDVKLVIADEKLIKYKYTGSFKNQETIWQVLDALKLTSPIDYSKTTFREFKINYKTN